MTRKTTRPNERDRIRMRCSGRPPTEGTFEVAVSTPRVSIVTAGVAVESMVAMLEYF
jgi:hypothetical protein